jgi:hypothetical protein
MPCSFATFSRTFENGESLPKLGSWYSPVIGALPARFAIVPAVAKKGGV